MDFLRLGAPDAPASFRLRADMDFLEVREDMDVDGRANFDAPPPPPDMAPTTSWWSVKVAACVVAAGAVATIAILVLRAWLKRRAAK
jgi:hypothetical protein